MRARHGHHMLALQDLFAQPLRARGVGKTGVEYCLHQGIAARHDIADDEQIGFQG